MKTEVYSYRLTPGRKARLQHAARQRKVKIAQVLDMALDEWFSKYERDIADDEGQKRLHAIAEHLIGVTKGNDPDRSASVSKRMRESLGRQYGR